VHQDVFNPRRGIEASHHSGEANDLRPGAYDREDLHVSNLLGVGIGPIGIKEFIGIEQCDEFIGAGVGD
jgi:hypothetical protein